MLKGLREQLKALFGLKFKNDKKCVVQDVLAQFHIQGDYNKSEMISQIANIFHNRICDLKNTGNDHNNAFTIVSNMLCQNKIQLTAKHSSQLQSIIQQYFQTNSQTNISINTPQNPTNLPIIARQMRMHQQIVHNIYNSQQNTYPCICNKPPAFLKVKQQQQTCYRCQKICHENCLWPKETDDLFQCPVCFLKMCLPTKEVRNIVFLGFLPLSMKDRIEYKIHFNCDTSTNKYAYEARCARLNRKSRFQLTWPENCVVSLNKNRLCEYKPLNFNSPLKRRNDQQLKLQKHHLNLNGMNELIIDARKQSYDQLRSSSQDNHLLMIVAICNKNQGSLTKKFMRNILQMQDSKAILKQYLNRGTNQIQIQRLTVSLKCQFYQSKINVPVRSKHCTSHYQPFDLRNFLLAHAHTSNSPVQKWRCPICKKRAYDLIIDEYIYSFMKNNKNIAQITFNGQGEPEIVEESQTEQQSQAHHQQSKAQQSQQNQIIINLIDLTSEQDDKNSLIAVTKPQKQQPIKPTQYIQILESDQQQKQLIKYEEISRRRNLKSRKLDNCIENQHIKGRKKKMEIQNPLFQMKSTLLTTDNAEIPESIFAPASNIATHKHLQLDLLLSPNILCSKGGQYSPNDTNIQQITPVNPPNEFFNPKNYLAEPALDTQPIQIESQNQSATETNRKKLKYQHQQLQKERLNLSRMYSSCYITPADQQLFGNICLRLLEVSLD